MKILLLDIEGTTTPISFVYDTLFPYARANVETFLRTQFDDPEVAKDRALLADETGADAESLDSLVAAVHALMDEDRKSTGLKSLQGKIWRAAYEDGSIRGSLFEDVEGVMRRIAERANVAIYSSGSVEAQKLLFANSSAGDLTPLISAYFDTNTGPKKVASSYVAIAHALQTSPDEILFGTDNLDEAKAARDAGVEAVILSRPGNHELPEHDFEVWETLEPALAY